MPLPRYNLPAAMTEFVDRVEQFDPAPDASPVVTVELRLAGESTSYALGDHTARALYEALCRYYDPADVGPCDRCGKRRLDANLQCRDCGHVNGVFGQVLLEHAEKIRREERELADLPADPLAPESPAADPPYAEPQLEQ